MNDFLLVYLGGDPEWSVKSTPEEMQAVMMQWGAWAQDMEAKGHLRSAGAGLRPGGSLVTNAGADVSTDAAMMELKELVGGFSLVRAKDLEQAKELATTTPFLKNNPQGTVLVRPCFTPPEA